MNHDLPQRHTSATAATNALAQLQAMTSGSAQAARLKALQKMADHSATKKTADLRHMAPDAAPVLQRMTLDYQVLREGAEFRYANNNEDIILNHMAAEWDEENNGAVGGGHLLDEMTDEWGAAVASSNPTPATAQRDQPADGVHFAASIPNMRRVINDQFTFKLVSTTAGGHKHVSTAKASTFWPTHWTRAMLAETLRNSQQLGGNANTFASKENTDNSFWYRWQTLGANTVFPLGMVTQVLGTERQNMRQGRRKALAYANGDQEN